MNLDLWDLLEKEFRVLRLGIVSYLYHQELCRTLDDNLNDLWVLGDIKGFKEVRMRAEK